MLFRALLASGHICLLDINLFRFLPPLAGVLAEVCLAPLRYPFFGFSQATVGAPDFFQSRKPPAIWATGSKPMRCSC